MVVLSRRFVWLKKPSAIANAAHVQATRLTRSHHLRGFRHERSPPVHTAELAERILGQLSRGRSLRAVCRVRGMPSLNTVLKWVSEDREGFAARYRQARNTGHAGRGRPSLCTTGIADRVLEQLSNGRRIGEICADPGMPSDATVRQWVIEDRAGFAARYRRARETGGAGTGRPTLYTPELADLILDELAGGRSLADVCRDPGMPAAGTVRLWVIENREGFAADYSLAREFGDHALASQILDCVDNRRHDWILRRKPNGETERILDPHRVRRAETLHGAALAAVESAAAKTWCPELRAR
jgi:transposase-like protein